MKPQSTVLCIDDDQTALDLIVASLTRVGYQAIGSTDPQTAIKLAIKTAPDCILLDWGMPTLSGLELLKLMRGEAKLRFTPIFMLTGRTTMEDAEKALDSGATGYFTKPINTNLIVRRVRKSIDDRQANA